ncbi:hypothetical protein PMIN03_012786 [Paraphaeosphaeria minitans]
MFCPMDPPIEDSIVLAKPNCWLLGSCYACELVDNVPNDAMASWEAGGDTYCIRKASTDNRDSVLGNSESNRVHHAGTSAAVWNIGGTFVKVKAWRDGMQLEVDTIQFVNRISSIPVPEIVFSWVDVEWNRSFLILKAIEGRTLGQAWVSLSVDQRLRNAGTVAQFCKTLALSTSRMLMTANGNGVLEPYLTAFPPDSEPSWKPQTLGPYTSDQLRSYLSESSVFDEHISSFKFYHADLGPSNIIVDEDGSIIGIIDWESAAFYPTFWLGTKPLVSAGFYVHGLERRAWAILLANALEREGFASNMEAYEAWRKAIGRSS